MLPIKTALCSFGMSGRLFHAPFLHINPGFTLYSVLERNKDLAVAQYPDIHTRRSMDELLNDKAVELVIVNTPSYTHFDYAKKALMAGKHVVVEKPFTATASEAEELAALARSRDRRLSVFQNRRYDSDFLTVKKILQEDWLGEILEAEIHYDRYNPALSPKMHKETPGPATGLVYDLGSHLIDQALQLFGVPDAIFADLGIMRTGSKVEDYMEILFYYPVLRVRIKSSYFVREALPSYIIHGRRGSFIKARTDTQEKDLLAGKTPGGEGWGVEPENEKGLLHIEKDGKIIRETVVSLKGNYGEYYDRLYEAIRQPVDNPAFVPVSEPVSVPVSVPVPVTAEDGINIIRMIETAYQSHREKRMIFIR
jgi:scyllo-inositol 2-dehydrogenase (NADP+)